MVRYFSDYLCFVLNEKRLVRYMNWYLFTNLKKKLFDSYIFVSQCLLVVCTKMGLLVFCFCENKCKQSLISKRTIEQCLTLRARSTPTNFPDILAYPYFFGKLTNGIMSYTKTLGTALFQKILEFLNYLFLKSITARKYL